MYLLPLSGFYHRLTNSQQRAAAQKQLHRFMLFLTGLLLLGSATYGQTGAALDFDGTNDYVDLGNSFGNFGTGDFSVECWFKAVSGYSYAENALVSKRSTSSCTRGIFWQLSMVSGGRVNFKTDDNTNSNNLPTTQSYSDGNWHHIIGIRKGVVLMIYVDGVLAAQNTFAAASNISSANTNPVLIGFSGCGKFKGAIDEVRIWNYALSSCEIQQRKNCELQGTESGLEAYYKFNQGTGEGSNAGVTTLTDASGNGRNGTLTNFALSGSTSNWIGTGGVTSGVSCATTISPTSLPVALTLLPSATITSGTSATLIASGANSYTWSSGENTSSITVSLTATTPYSVTGAINTCTGTASTTVSVIPSLTMLVVSSATSVCAGGSVSLTANISGGSKPYNYTWVAPADITITGSGSVVSAAASSTLSGPQTVTIQVGDAINSPISQTTIALTVGMALTVSISGNLSIASGSSTTLTASGANSYIWSTGQSTTAISLSNVTSSTTISVTGTADGCSSVTTVGIVAIPQSPTLTAGVLKVCTGTPLAITASCASGTPSFTASPSAGSSSGNVYTFDATTTAGVYSLSATCINNGLSSTTTTLASSLSINQTPTVTINPSFTSINVGQSATLTASGANSYTWNTGDKTNSITASPAQTTAYSVTGTGINGCEASSSASISVACGQPIQADAISVTQTALLGSGNCAVNLQGQGYGTGYIITGPGNYVFSTVYRNVTSYTINGLNVTQPGTYTFTVTYSDACGERSRDTMTYVVTGTACK